jgi:hypothetical protein
MISSTNPAVSSGNRDAGDFLGAIQSSIVLRMATLREVVKYECHRRETEHGRLPQSMSRR